MTNNNSSESRRKLLKSIAAGSGAVVAGKSLPENWVRPVVDSVVLPAHAQATGGAPTSDGSTTLRRLTSSGVITNPNVMAPATGSRVAEKPDILEILVPSAHAAACAVEGQCGSVSFTSTNNGTLTVTNVGDSPFVLNASHAASGMVGRVPYTIQLNADRSSGSIAFQGACSGYGVTLGTSGSCTPVSTPSCIGTTATDPERVIVAYDFATGALSSRGGLLNTIQDYNLETLLFRYLSDTTFGLYGNRNGWLSIIPSSGSPQPYGQITASLTRNSTSGGTGIYTLNATVELCGVETISVSGLSITPPT